MEFKSEPKFSFFFRVHLIAGFIETTDIKANIFYH